MYSTEVRLKWPTLRTRTFTLNFSRSTIYSSKPNIKIDLYFFFINGYEICFYQSTDNQLY